MKQKKVKKDTKLFEWQARNLKNGSGRCTKCQRIAPRLTVDHIIPVSILRMLDEGEELTFNDEENFQLMCYPCNSFKMDRIDITNPKTAVLLVKYMQPYLKATN